MFTSQHADVEADQNIIEPIVLVSEVFRQCVRVLGPQGLALLTANSGARLPITWDTLAFALERVEVIFTCLSTAGRRNMS